MTSRNIGKFQVRRGFVQRDPELVADMFGHLQIVPVWVEFVFHTDVMEYTAISPKFEEVPEGCVVPEYYIIAHKEEGQPARYTVEARS